ncbi:MAG: response regulator transcription factor [Lachnospiraceae bacterium]|nr:response regulator transcription factor [Lachnospiraceae bacterium]
MIKVGICDEGQICRANIGKLVKKYFTKRSLEYQLREYESGKSFMEQGEKVDILLLDIEMEGISGIQLKNWLNQKKSDTKIIFVTNHTEGMTEAFGRNVYGFLKKPPEPGELEICLGRITEEIEENESLTIKSINQEFVIKIKNVFYFVSEKKYSRMVSGNGVHFCDMSLSQLEEKLKYQSFFRCHRSYLVNLRNIYCIKDNVCMKNGDVIPVSRRKVKNLKDSYQLYIEKKVQ